MSFLVALTKQGQYLSQTLIHLRWLWRRTKPRPDAVEIILEHLRQNEEAFDNLFGAGAGDADLALAHFDVAGQVGQGDAAKLRGEGYAERGRPGSGHRLVEPAPQAFLDGLRGDHLVEKAKQGSAVGEVGAADGLDFADGLHEGLRGGAAYSEEVFNVVARPSFGAGACGAFAEVVDVAGPLNGPGQGKSLQNGHVQDSRDYWPTCQKCSLTCNILPTTMPIVRGKLRT